MRKVEFLLSGDKVGLSYCDTGEIKVFNVSATFRTRVIGFMRANNLTPTEQTVASFPWLKEFFEGGEKNGILRGEGCAASHRNQ